MAGREVLKDKGVEELTPVGIIVDERGEPIPCVGKFTLDTANKNLLSPHDLSFGLSRIDCILSLCVALQIRHNDTPTNN